MRLSLNALQPLGRALMLPIAVLPVAGILLRLGQPDLLGIAFIADAGGAIFSNLGLLFAIGVAVGLARENHGAAGLAGAVAYFVTFEGAKSLLIIPPDITAGYKDAIAATLGTAWKTKEMAKLGVPVGLYAGLISGWLYNRYAAIALPDYLAFFGGRRFVPIAAGFAGLFGAALFGYGFPSVEAGLDALSQGVIGSGNWGLFAYGVLNRLLIVTGLHHILNNIAWFLIGDFHGTTGDLNRFFAGDKTAGAFMSGFFPVMMFGLPAACLAMYRSAAPERRKGVAGLFLSLGLTSLLTGVTEPIEFTFMFLAPVLYLIHAILTGVAMVVMSLLGVRLGFGFSAGLIDYVLNFGLATRPLLLIPIGLVYAGVYYASFRFCIVRFNLKTPGRDKAAATATSSVAGTTRAEALIAALGGSSNLRSINACTTRLRLEIVNMALIDEAALTAAGSRGVLRPGGNALQVVLGPIADSVAGEMRAIPSHAHSALPPAIVTALGGEQNIARHSRSPGRLQVELREAGRIDDSALDAAATRGWCRAGGNAIHILD